MIIHNSACTFNDNLSFYSVKINNNNHYNNNIFIDQKFYIDSSLVSAVGVRLSGLIRNSIPVAPVSNTGYTCSPFLPVGVLLTNSGILISFKGVTGSINNKYYCTSPELGGTVIIDLTVAGEYINIPSKDKFIAGYLESMHA